MIFFTTSYYTNCLPTIDQATEYLKKEKPPPMPSTPSPFFAKFVGINENSPKLWITTSHGKRIMENIEDSFLIYPGKVLSNNRQFWKIRNDVEILKSKIKVELETAVILFNCNDIDKYASTFTSPTNLPVKEIKQKLNNGNQNQSINSRDPLNICDT